MGIGSIQELTPNISKHSWWQKLLVVLRLYKDYLIPLIEIILQASFEKIFNAILAWVIDLQIIQLELFKENCPKYKDF